MMRVQDIRVIPAAQDSAMLPTIEVEPALVTRYPILRYRLTNLRSGVSVRGLGPLDSRRCWLVLDDMAVMGDQHYPCIIHLREGGTPIGSIHSPTARTDRVAWSETHDCFADPICRTQCLDVCRDYNAAATRLHAV